LTVIVSAGERAAMRIAPFRMSIVVVASALAISSVRVGAAVADEGRGEFPRAVAHLRLQATQPDVRFFVRTAARDLYNTGSLVIGAPGVRVTLHTFSELCAAPCEVELPAGEYFLGMTTAGSRILESRMMHLIGDETLTGTWVYRHAVRVVGGIVGAASMIAGFALAARGLGSCQDGMRCHEKPFLWLGLGLLVGGASTAIVTQLQSDRAEFEGAP
jgi:hypothetical protein